MATVAFEAVVDIQRDGRRRKARRAPDGGAKLLGLSPFALLAACGGAGGGTEPIGAPPPEPFTGQADSMPVPVGSATVTGNVLTNDASPGGPSLAVMRIGVQNGAVGTVGQPLQGNLGQLTIQADGSFTYAVGAGTSAFAALAEGQSATETFVYTPSANGAGGNPQTLTLTLTGVNDAPIAAADTGSALSADVRTPVTGNVLDNDRDPDAGAALTVTGVRAGSGQLAQGLQGGRADGLPAVVGTYGTLTMSSDGAYSYVLDVTDPDTLALAAGQTGTETFTYTVSDGKLSTTAILTFSVAGADEAPSAAPGPFGETDGDDIITGTAGADTIAARGGDDVIEALAGADIVDGGPGNDTISYASSTAPEGVAVYLSQSSPNADGDAEGDQLTSIENVIGSAFADLLFGDNGANRLSGGDGDDSFEGFAGADVFDGGAGINDWVRYLDSDAGVMVDLVDGRGFGGHAEGDTFINIEGFLGSQHDDTLRGDDGANFLSGREGNDIIEGRGGNDQLRGATGADRLDGGDGVDAVSYVTSTAGVEIDLVAGTGRGGEAEGDTLISIENVSLTNSNDLIVSSAAANHLSGGFGSDTVSYAASTAAVTINLLAGTASGGFAAGDTLINFENLIGSAYGDALTGNSGVNSLSGGNGNDTLEGGSGADALDGGAGIDTASYRSAIGPVTVSLASGTGVGSDAQGDVLSNIENLEGTVLGDTLTGNALANRLSGLAGNDTLSGGDGDDVLEGGFGADMLDGGNGIDFASYAAATAGVTVNLANTALNTGEAAGDSYTSIEGVIGSVHADTLVGQNIFNRLDGGAGNDIITGGGVGDLLIGGAGADALDGGDVSIAVNTASYEGSGAGVTVNLTTGTGTGGDAEGDTLVNINALLGSRFADALTGSSGDNRLEGGDGNDILAGAGGDDWLVGGAGADALDGGSGIDYADYSGSAAGVTIDLAANTASGGEAAGDTFTGVEGLIGSDFADALTGDAADNEFYGGLGADTLTGGLGADTFNFDLLTVDADRDRITDFQSGTDKLFFAEDEFDVAALFTSGAAPTATTTQAAFLYDTGTGELRYDADGNGAGAAVLVAIIDGAPALQASDILVA